MSTETHYFSPARPPSVWGNRNVVLVWLSQLVSLFGDHIFYVTMIWLTLEITGDNGIAGLVAMSVHLPMVIFSLFAGPLVDRWDRRQVMIVADAARFLLLLLFPLLFELGLLTVLAIATLSFLVQSFATLFLPARDVLIGEITPRPLLPNANALVQSATPIAMIAGPAAAGALLPIVGMQHLFSIDAATFAVSLLLLLAVHRPEKLVDRHPRRSRLLSEVKEGLSYALRHSVIGWLLLITAVDNWFIMGPAIIGLPIFAREVIGGPQLIFGLSISAAQVYALCYVTFAAGFILCSAFIHHLNLRLNKGRLLLLGIFLDGITYVPLLWINDPLTLWILMFLHGLAVPPIVVSRTSLIQEIVPDRLQGRVFSMINLTVTGVTALTVGTTGFLADAMGVHVLFGLWGAIAALTGPVGWLFPSLRRAGENQTSS